MKQNLGIFEIEYNREEGIFQMGAGWVILIISAIIKLIFF